MMPTTPIDSYDVLAQMVSDHLCRGVRTNTIVTEAAYAPAITAGTLTAQNSPAGLLLWEDRRSHHYLHFWLNDLDADLNAALPVPTVTEVAFRPRDTGLQEAVSYLTQQGFSTLFYRKRLSRPSGPCPVPEHPLRTPGPEEAPAVLAALQENFSALTGCLPNAQELARDLAQQQVLTLEDAVGIVGLLHFSYDGKHGEIRHLAVRASARGTGCTKPLIAGYLNAIGGQKSIVWAREDYPAAQAAYTAFGFTPDGRRAAVLYNKKEGFLP